MKLWQTPSLNELNVNATSYHPNSGHNVDGSYTSRDGKYEFATYAPSSGNSGEVVQNGNTPSQNNSNGMIGVH